MYYFYLIYNYWFYNSWYFFFYIQVNLEYFVRVVFNKDGVFYSDSFVGTDFYIIMIDGLGVVGWGVGGIEAEVVMFG